MSSVNVSNPNVGLTVRVFDSFNAFDFNVPAAEYDVVYSFFRTKFTTSEAARSFTTVLFRISVDNNIPAMELLDQIRAMDRMELTVTMAYYLNGQRSPTTLLGVSQVLLPNYYAARNVVQ